MKKLDRILRHSKVHNLDIRHEDNRDSIVVYPHILDSSGFPMERPPIYRRTFDEILTELDKRLGQEHRCEACNAMLRSSSGLTKHFRRFPEHKTLGRRHHLSGY